LPTVVFIKGWRLFFFSDEGNEPIHIHACKGEAECKYWLNTELFDIEEAWSYNMTPRLRREVRRLILEHFDLIAEEWQNHFRGRR